MVKKQEQTQKAQQSKAQADAKTEETQKSQAESGERFADPEHKELLAKCEALGVKGIDWQQLLMELGVSAIQVLLRFLQQNQKTGLRATPEGDKIQCSPDQLACLDEAIDNAMKLVGQLCDHRCCCCCDEE